MAVFRLTIGCGQKLEKLEKLGVVWNGTCICQTDVFNILQIALLLGLLEWHLLLYHWSKVCLGFQTETSLPCRLPENNEQCQRTPQDPCCQKFLRSPERKGRCKEAKTREAESKKVPNWWLYVTLKSWNLTSDAAMFGTQEWFENRQKFATHWTTYNCG